MSLAHNEKWQKTNNKRNRTAKSRKNQNAQRKEKVLIRDAFNKFPDFFVQAFKILVDTWKFTMLLLYNLWDDRPIFIVSGSNEHL